MTSKRKNVVEDLEDEQNVSDSSENESQDSDSAWVAAQRQSSGSESDDDDDDDDDVDEEDVEKVSELNTNNESTLDEDGDDDDDDDDSDDDEDEDSRDDGSGGDNDDVSSSTTRKVSKQTESGGRDTKPDHALEEGTGREPTEGSSEGGLSREERRAAKRKARELARYKRFGDKLAARGVVYLARVPPFMKPEKVKVLIERSVPETEVTRLYLVPEDSALARRRKKLGGQRGTNYTEGWIEFATRKQARRCEAMLHMQKIGGKKRSHYREDTWTLKYLRHFTWSHLTEKKAYERRVREHKLRLEMVAAKKQNEEFRGLVDQHKAHKAMQERKQQRSGGTSTSGGGGGGGGEAELAKVKRRFHQHKPLTLDGSAASASSSFASSSLGGGVGLSSTLLGAALGRKPPPQKKQKRTN